MNSIQFIQMALDELHRSFRAEVRELTPEQLRYRPSAEANTVNFLVWHWARVEDSTIHNNIGEPRPLIWTAGRWHERLGVEENASGTGFNGEQVGAFQPDRDELLAYFRAVWEESDAAIATLTDDDLDRVLNPERPQMTLGRSLQSLLIGHGYWHLGEVRFLKGLQGMPFSR